MSAPPSELDTGSSDDDDDEASAHQSTETSDDSAEVVPISATDTSDYPSSATTSDSNLERLYRGTPTRTRLLQIDRLRVLKKRVRTEVPYVTKKKQARDGCVKAFVPRIYSQCCKRRCCKHFDDPKADMLVLARKPLFDETLTRAAMRRNNRKIDKVGRLEAKQFLCGHYDWVARERAAEIHKVTNRCSLFFGGGHPHSHPASIYH